MSPATRSPLAARWRTWMAGAIIAIAAITAYHGTFRAPFAFDDAPAIVENPSIRDLWDWPAVLSPPPSTAGAFGRPLVNLSLALNYAVGGLDVRGYHALNLLLHVLAGLILFGLVRRTLLRPACRGLFPRPVSAGTDALSLAFATALLWTVHPLLTESVTSVVQRDEVLATLLLFFVLYAFGRGIESPHRRLWFVAAATANFLGMASKEIMAAAPLLVLLYDRTFVAGSFRTAWRERRGMHGAFAGGWLLLAWLIVHHHGRNSTVGLDHGVGVASYALTQCWAIVHYVSLAFWPAPLVFDYGTDFFTRLDSTLLTRALVLIALGGGTVWAMVRRPALGFAGACFFLILAPSSSVVPLVTQAMAEHRMYGPLAAIVTLVVIGGRLVIARWRTLLLSAAAVALMTATIARNGDYRSELALWRDTAAKCPQNARAHYNLGNILRRTGDNEAALREYEIAIRLQPDVVHARLNHADVLERLNRHPEAIADYEEALRIDPQSAQAHHNLAVILERAGRVAEAVAHYQAALRFEDDDTAGKTQVELADALVQLNRLPEALPHYEAALRAQPASSGLHSNLGTALYQLGRSDEARVQFEQALHLDPENAAAHANLGFSLLALGRVPEAVRELEAAKRLAPGNESIRTTLAAARARLLP